MHALTLLQGNRLAVLIFREYSEQLFDQLTTNRSVTRGTVKILLFRHAHPTCSWVTCCWTLTSCVPWPEIAPAAMILIQCWFCWLSGLSQNWFLILFMYLFFIAKHLHCSDVIVFSRSISDGAVIHTDFVCTLNSYSFHSIYWFTINWYTIQSVIYFQN